MLFFSVPVLMLLVPPIEINVECHDASGDHARDQGPVEEKEQKKFRISKIIPRLPQEDSELETDP